MADYIARSNITDSLLLETPLTTLLTAKITACNTALESLALRNDVLPTMIETSPLHDYVVRWCVAWTCSELCFDLMGKNKNDNLEMDIYFQKYKEYDKRKNDVELQINYAVLTGVVIDSDDVPSNTTRLYRS